MRDVDLDHLNWMIKSINKKKGTPYAMANEELADKMFPFVKDKFPEAIIIKIGIEQYITITKRAQNKLIKILKEHKIKHENTIKEIDNAIENLR